MCDVLKYFSINIVRIMQKKEKQKKMWKYSHDCLLAKNYFALFLLILSTLWIISDILLETWIFHSLSGKKEKKKAAEQCITVHDELRLHSYGLQLKNTG